MHNLCISVLLTLGDASDNQIPRTWKKTKTAGTVITDCCCTTHIAAVRHNMSEELGYDHPMHHVFHQEHCHPSHSRYPRRGIAAHPEVRLFPPHVAVFGWEYRYT